MANTTTMTIRTDVDTKKNAQKLFKDLGMDMTTAVNIFFRQALRVNGLPFEVTAEKPNRETEKVLIESAAGRNMSKRYHSVEEVMEALNA